MKNTFLLIFSCVLLCSSVTPIRRTKVAIIPFTGSDVSYPALLKKEIEQFYAASDVTVFPAQKLPAFAYYKPRNRYRADSLIKHLKQHLPSGYDLILGVTAKDISTKDEKHEDWGIFGLGYLGGPSCIVSDFRLKKTAKDKQHTQERLIKVALHELGHTYGLPHCSADSKCLMRDAEGSIKSVDTEEKYLCESCKRRLPKR